LSLDAGVLVSASALVFFAKVSRLRRDDFELFRYPVPSTSNFSLRSLDFDVSIAVD
jgi:hypothetical protein